MGVRQTFWYKLFWLSLSVGSLWGLYQLGVTHFLRSIYEERSLGFLNGVMAGRDLHPLSFYTAKADSLMRYILLWIFLMGCLGIVSAHYGEALAKSMGKGIGYPLLVTVSLLVAFLFGEVVVRMAGFKPWDPSSKPMTVEPGGRVAGLHPLLGYAMLPGRYTVTLLHTGYKFTITHGDDSLRITRPLDSNPVQPYEGEIWIFGCSFTYGWSLNDEETFSWLLQEKFPNYRIVNFGTIGYGTLQSLIQFREALKTGRKPVLAIYAYGSFHDVRNTHLRSRAKAVVPGKKFGPVHLPYAELRAGQLIWGTANDADFREFPLVRHSALIRLIESRYDEFEARFADSRKVTERILLEFDRTAKEKEIPFLVAGIDSESSEVLAYLRGHGIPTVDISVDLSKPVYRNGPHDSHPSVLANQKYAANLSACLRTQLRLKSTGS